MELRADIVINLAVLVLGILVIIGLLRSRWPGWLGYPLVLLIVQAIRDLGMGPLLLELRGITYEPSLLFTRVQGEEALPAIILVFLSYSMIGIGLISIRLILNLILPYGHGIKTTAYSPKVMSRGWYVGLVVFGIGLCAYLIEFAFLLTRYSLSEIAASRAVFTDEASRANPIFGYATLTTSPTFVQPEAIR